jgi:predicted nucleotidyltransferase
MTVTLDKALEVLRANAEILRARGVLHAAIFGSVARGDADEDSDIDVLVDLQPGKPCGMFEYVRLQIDISQLLGRKVDLVEREALRSFIRETAMHEAVDAF